MGRSLGCDIIDSGIPPNKDSPFSGNLQLYNTILTDKCTDYQRDDVGNILWLSPLNGSATLIPNNICFENATFYGINTNNSAEASYAVAYCNNIADENSYIGFQFPQDSDFRQFFNGGYNVPEWGNSSQLASNQSIHDKYETALIGAGAAAALYESVFTGGGLLGLTSGGLLNAAIGGVANTITLAGNIATGTLGAGTVTEAGTETTAVAVESTISDAAVEAGVEAFAAGATVGADSVAATLAAGAFASATAGLAAAASTGVGAVVVIGVIVAGFAKDLEDVKCSYDDLNPPTLVADRLVGACCRGHCAIAGKNASCVRNSGFGYNASYFQCCLSDFSCNKVQANCFNTTTNNTTDIPTITTCHPEARNLSSNMCATVIGAYCTGQTPFANNQSTLIDAWQANGVMEFENANGQTFSVKAPCLNLIARLLTGGTTYDQDICTWDDFIAANLYLTPQVLNPVGLTIAQDILGTFLENYLKTHGSPFGRINQDAYIESSDLITWYFGLCKAYPFLCQTALTSFCANLTPDDLLSEPSSIKWCGCYLQDQYYEKYNIYNISKQCTPLCNIDTNIPLIGDDGVQVPCTETVCMIDDLSISLTNSFTTGGINFSQVCNSCGKSQIVKKYNSDYSYSDNTNISEFFQIAPLSKDEFANVIAPYNTNTNLAGYEVIDSNTNNTYAFSANTQYTIIQQNINSQFNGITFNLGVPIVVPGGSDIIYYLESFTQDTITLLTNNNFTANLDPTNASGSNIFKILLNNNQNLPGIGNKFFYIKVFYYKAGKTTDNNGNTISQSFAQSIYDDVSQYNVGIINKSCNCTISGDSNFINTQITNLNISNNCGNTTCTDTNGNRIPCGDNSIDLNNNINIINTVTDNVDGFNNLTISQRTEFVTTSTLSLFAVVIMIKIFITIYPKKYYIILPVFFFILIIVIAVIYLVYSNSFNMDSFGNVFQSLKI